MAAAEPMGGADRISTLPEEIKTSILSRLNVKYAIRTSALARSWRHLWTLLPCLCIGVGQDALGVCSADVTSDWIERAHHLVSSLRGPFDLFDLSHRFTSHQAPLVQRLLDLLLQKGSVQMLRVWCLYDQLLVHLPPFQSLKVLQLSNCHVVIPTGFQGFNSLTTLELRRVRISNDHLHFLIHTSNNLTTFSGSRFLVSEDPLSVCITLPLLKHLTFGINDSVDKVSIISAPCLEQVQIFTWNCTDSSFKKLALVSLVLLTSVAMVSSLTLDTNFLKCLSLVSLPFNITFPQLRSLMFFLDIDTMDKMTYDAFFMLLRSMPSVEELNLTYLCFPDEDNWVEIMKEELLGKKQDGISCLNQTLKFVTINRASAMIGITFGKFFMLNAKALKLMKFNCYSRPKVEPGMIEELQKAELTSSDAKVVIFCDLEDATIDVI